MRKLTHRFREQARFHRGISVWFWIVQFAGVLSAVVQIETGVVPARFRQGSD
jgi:hypothetical protein